MFGSIISAGASLLGGLLGSRSSNDAAADNYAAQKEFAQNGIRWKVEDAKAAGIHPLAALGMQPISFSPSYAGDNSMGSSLAQAGSDISRAIEAKTTRMERLQERLLEAQIQGQEIENAARASRTARLTDPTQMPPPLPGAVDLQPSTSVTNILGNRGIEAGVPPGVKGYVMPDGSTMMVPSPGISEGLEAELNPYTIEHYLRNRVTAPISWGLQKYKDFMSDRARSAGRWLQRNSRWIDEY